MNSIYKILNKIPHEQVQAKSVETEEYFEIFIPKVFQRYNDLKDNFIVQIVVSFNR